MKQKLRLILKIEGHDAKIKERENKEIK